MEPDAMLKTAEEGAKAVTKLGELVEKFFGPYLTKKQADADAYAEKRKIQIIRENADMNIVYENGIMNARMKSVEELMERANQRMLSEAVREQNNLENILEITAHELGDTKDISGENISDDWATRFFDIAKDINSDEMKIIWGKILAGEIKRPGTFSLKTLDVVRNLNSNDAMIFQKIMPLITENLHMKFITTSDKILKTYGINYLDIMALDEAGLINSDSDIWFVSSATNVTAVNISNDNWAISINGLTGQDTQVAFKIYKITRAGKELYEMLSQSSSKEYMLDFAKEIYESNKNISVKVYKVKLNIGVGVFLDGEPIKIY